MNKEDLVKETNENLFKRKERKKKPMPKFWYKGRPVMDEDKLIRRLEKDGRLAVTRDITIYRYCQDLSECVDLGFGNDAEDVLRNVSDYLKDLGSEDAFDFYGIRSVEYDAYESITIDGKKIGWYYGIRKLAQKGLFEIVPHVTLYRAIDPIDDYCYTDPEEPLEVLKEADVFFYFEFVLEDLPSSSVKRLAKKYDLGEVKG